MASQPIQILVFDIEDKLTQIECVFSTYIPLLPELIFVKHLRYPITGKERLKLDTYFDKKLVRDTPWLSYLCVEYVLDMLKIMLYHESSEAKLFVANPLRPDECASFVNLSELNYSDCVIAQYIPNISTKDSEYIFSLVSEIFDTILPYVYPKYENHLVEFDASGSQVLMLINEHITTFRFNELLITNDVEEFYDGVYEVTDIVTGETTTYSAMLDITRQLTCTILTVKLALARNDLIKRQYSIKKIKL